MKIPLVAFIILVMHLLAPRILGQSYYRKSVEVFGTGANQLRAYQNLCSGTFTLKSDGTRGIATTIFAESCGAENRWQVAWPDELMARWSDSNHLRLVPCDLSIPGGISVFPAVAVPGESLDISFSIHNIGEGNAPPSCTKVALLDAKTFDSIVSEDEIETSEIIPTDAILFSTKLTIPSNAPPGKYIIYAEVDSCVDAGQTNFVNDVKESASITLNPLQYTVTSLAGVGGTIMPSEVFSVTNGSQVIWHTTPDSGYEVDSWIEDGIAVQSGGVTFTITSISRNTTIKVTFKPKLYLLDVIIHGLGSVILGPAQTAYASGTQITFNCLADSSTVFAECTGDLYAGNPQFAAVKKPKDETMHVWFAPRIPQPTVVPVFAISTPPVPWPSVPSGTISIRVPSAPMWFTIIESAANGDACFQIREVHEGDGSDKGSNYPMSEHKEAFKCTQYMKVTTPPFLYFPLTNEDKTPASADVTSIMDHSLHSTEVVWSYFPKNNCIRTFLGESFEALNGVDPFSSQLFFPPSSGIHYVGAVSTHPSEPDHYLGYDEHPGYDFYASEATPVFAAAEGDILDTGDSGECADEFAKGLGLVKLYMHYRHAIVIRHNNQYCTVYMHLSSASCKFADTSKPAFWKPITGHVKAGEFLGRVGGFLHNCDGSEETLHPHLHFEVWRRDTMPDGSEKWVFADPYGFFFKGTQIFPNLWNYSRFSCPVTIPPSNDCTTTPTDCVQLP